MFVFKLSLLIVPFCIKKLIEFIKNKDKVNIRNLIITVAIPYISIGLLVMAYNNARFGSIFEFGAKYQLTSSNILALGARIEILPFGFWQYLFNPMQILPRFPFIYMVDSMPFFMGYYGNGNKGIGVFSLNSILWLLFLLPFLRKAIKEKSKELWQNIIMFIIVGVLIICALTIMGGTFARYSLDFEWLLSISAVLVASFIIEKLR